VSRVTVQPQVADDRLLLPTELLARSGFLLIQLGGWFKARAVRELTEAGFSQYHYSVLAVLAEQPRGTQATIADTLGLDRSQLVGILDALEERGLISRQRDAKDRRRHLVSLTADGRRTIGRLRATINRLEEELFAPLDPDSREQLHRMLLRLANYHDPRCAQARTT
jgi:MarR family transcriptional regulator, lower aerobic nicotinate degradation pathway regulator